MYGFLSAVQPWAYLVPSLRYSEALANNRPIAMIVKTRRQTGRAPPPLLSPLLPPLLSTVNRLAEK